MKLFTPLLILCLFLASCEHHSLFIKRKYRKGFFVNRQHPAKNPTLVNISEPCASFNDEESRIAAITLIQHSVHLSHSPASEILRSEKNETIYPETISPSDTGKNSQSEFILPKTASETTISNAKSGLCLLTAIAAYVVCILAYTHVLLPGGLFFTIAIIIALGAITLGIFSFKDEMNWKDFLGTILGFIFALTTIVFTILFA